MDKIQAINGFWNSFGIKAYDVATVPEEMNFTNPKNEDKLPYITYEVNVGDYGDDVVASASVWYYSRNWKAIEDKMKDIDEVFNNGGAVVGYDGGNVWIKKANPYRMRVQDENDMVRRYVINVMIEYH